jgi:hypothetical protein
VGDADRGEFGGDGVRGRRITFTGPPTSDVKRGSASGSHTAVAEVLDEHAGRGS